MDKKLFIRAVISVVIGSIIAVGITVLNIYLFHPEIDYNVLYLIPASTGGIVGLGFFVCERRIMHTEDKLKMQIDVTKRLIPMCSHCKKVLVRPENADQSKEWLAVDEFLRETLDLIFTHSVCPNCMHQHYDVDFLTSEKEKDV